jgi:hypothetical protein
MGKIASRTGRRLLHGYGLFDAETVDVVFVSAPADVLTDGLLPLTVTLAPPLVALFVLPSEPADELPACPFAAEEEVTVVPALTFTRGSHCRSSSCFHFHRFTYCCIHSTLCGLCGRIGCACDSSSIHCGVYSRLCR